MEQAGLGGRLSQEGGGRDVEVLPLLLPLLLLGVNHALDQLSLLLLPTFRRGQKHLEVG